MDWTDGGTGAAVADERGACRVIFLRHARRNEPERGHAHGRAACAGGVAVSGERRHSRGHENRGRRDTANSPPGGSSLPLHAQQQHPPRSCGRGRAVAPVARRAARGGLVRGTPTGCPCTPSDGAAPRRGSFLRLVLLPCATEVRRLRRESASAVPSNRVSERTWTFPSSPPPPPANEVGGPGRSHAWRILMKFRTPATPCF